MYKPAEHLAISKYIAKHHPEIHKDAMKIILPKELPGIENIKVLRNLSNYYTHENRLLFIIAFIIIYDRRAMELEIRIRGGIRQRIANVLQVDETNVSKMFYTAKTRYQYIPEFKRRTDEIVSEYKRKFNL